MISCGYQVVLQWLLDHFQFSSRWCKMPICIRFWPQKKGTDFNDALSAAFFICPKIACSRARNLCGTYIFAVHGLMHGKFQTWRKMNESFVPIFFSFGAGEEREEKKVVGWQFWQSVPSLTFLPGPIRNDLLWLPHYSFSWWKSRAGVVQNELSSSSTTMVHLIKKVEHYKTCIQYKVSLGVWM